MTAAVDNLRATGAGHAYGDLQAAREVRALADAEARREALLADVDCFTDWLAAECTGATNEQSGYVFTSGARHDMAQKTTPRLVAYLLYPSDVSSEAAYELRARYLRAKGIAE